MAEDLKTSDVIVANASAGTAPGALSMASETTSPRTEGGEPSRTKDALSVDHETRIQKLEDEIAFLRQILGWPERA